MSSFISTIQKELSTTGGRLEWATDYGVGVSFARGTLDVSLLQIPETIKHLVWISLKDTFISDSSLATLSHASQLEDIDLSGTAVSIAGITHFLSHVRTLQRMSIACCPQLEEAVVELKEKYAGMEIVV